MCMQMPQRTERESDPLSWSFGSCESPDVGARN